MLTGDKIETAKCIAISAAIKSPLQEIFEIKNCSDMNEIRTKCVEFSQKQNNVLLIDGQSLGVVFENDPQQFFSIAINAPSVICCRCLPT